jgi:HK97 family phage major capsid protein
MTLVLGSVVLGTLAPLMVLAGFVVVFAFLGSVDAFPVEEFREGLGEIKRGIGENREGLGALEGKVKSVEAEHNRLRGELDRVRRHALGRPGVTRRAGWVSEDCAQWLGAAFVLGNARSGRLDPLDAHYRERLFNAARGVFGLETRAALTTTDVPLPTEYYGQLRELISDFGVVRSRMFPFPIGMGTARLPRFKTRPVFNLVAMSAPFPEKSPQADFATLESHKIGGIVRVPREIDEQSIVTLGQFLARYGAIEFARAEDTWGFLADGTATYDNVKGVCKVASDNAKVVQLAATKTKPSDATLADFRAMRTKVNKAALRGRGSAYYLDSTWETQLLTFNTVNDKPYVRNPDGSASLDGYQIVWTDVLEPFGTAAAAGKFLAVFGALDFWWFGEHGQPRMDFSAEVYFATDELATRFIEEIDFDYQQADATSALQTAAA